MTNKMLPLKDNQDVACFYVTKHSWKGKYVLRLVEKDVVIHTIYFNFRYKRIFSVGSEGITTYNPSTLEVTNRWLYSDFISLQPIRTGNLPSSEFHINMKKEKKIDNMKFSTEHRAQLLTEALKYCKRFAEKKEFLVCNLIVLCACLLNNCSCSDTRHTNITGPVYGFQ